jgi:hypothetical protein
MRRLPIRFLVAGMAVALVCVGLLTPMRAGAGPVAATPTPRSVTTTPTPRPTRDRNATCQAAFKPVSRALTDLGKAEYVRMDGTRTGYQGGLYPGGSNARPPAHLAAGLAIAGQIVPLDAQGRPAHNGKIVLLAIGVSNTMIEFRDFERNLLPKQAGIDPRLVAISGAVAGQGADQWVNPDSVPWQVVSDRLRHRKVSPQQVQVVWVKHAYAGGKGGFPDAAQRLQADLEAITRNLKTKYPNLQIAYFSSRTRSYDYSLGVSPEPLAFETGYAVKWMVEKQINGDPSLNFDPQRGPVLAPYVTWGPYLWIDGENPRSDGRTWLAQDLQADCVHPSANGSRKVAEMLMAFLLTDPTAAGWFRASP